MRRRDFCLAPAAAALASCASKPSGALRTIQVGIGRYPGLSPFFIALERGYFRDNGIDPRQQTTMRNVESVGLLSAGRLDVAMTPIGPSLFNAVANGSSVRIVLGREKVTSACGDAGTLYARKPAFPQGTDVRYWSGKNISSGNVAGVAEFLLDTILSRAGLDPKQTPRPRLDQIQAAAALVSGAIDGLMQATNVPLDFGSHREIVREESGRKLTAGLQLSQVVFGPGLLNADVSLGARFLACYMRGVREFEAGATPQYLKDLVAEQGRSASALAECRAYSTPGGAIDRKSIEVARDWALARGYSTKIVPVESVIDERFLRFAQKELGV